MTHQNPVHVDISAACSAGGVLTVLRMARVEIAAERHERLTRAAADAPRGRKLRMEAMNRKAL